MKLHRPSIKRMRSVLAVGLMLWCAGAGCAIVSYAHAAEMNRGETVSLVKPNFSGASASVMAHACCKARHSSKRDAGARHPISRSERFTGFQQVSLPAAPSPSGAMSCCPLTSGSFVVASRSQSKADASALTQKDSLSLAIRDAPTAPQAGPLRLPNQEQTYLRCCVFLI